MPELPDEPNPREPLAMAAWTMAGVEACLHLAKVVLLSRLLPGASPAAAEPRRRALQSARTLGKDRSLDP